jgi:hypothetical protein
VESDNVRVLGELLTKIAGLPFQPEDAEDPPCPHLIYEDDQISVECVGKWPDMKISVWPITAQRFDWTDRIFYFQVQGEPAPIMGLLPS